MNLKTLLFPILALAITFSACKKDTDTPSEPENDLPLGTLQFKANGEQYVFTGVIGIVAIDSLVSNSKQFTINAVDLTASKSFTLIIEYSNSTPPEAGVAYESAGSSCVPGNSFDTCPILGFIPGPPDTNTYASSGNQSAKAYVKFSELQLNGGVAKGEFTGTLVGDSSSELMEITEGEFHVSVL